MNDNFSFLSRLKPLGAECAGNAADNDNRGDFFFRISFRDGVAYVNTVDAKGKVVEPDPRCYGGDEGAMLRSLSNAGSSRRRFIAWGSKGADAGADAGLSLADNPLLIFQLTRCSNLVDAKNKKLKFVDSKCRMAMVMEPATAEPDSATPPMLKPHLQLRKASGELTDNFALLSDSFAISGHEILPISPLGENYASLAKFTEPINEDSASEYLSLLLSYVQNVEIVYGDRTFDESHVPVAAVPTIQIEKVDADKALYLRSTQTVGQLNPDFVENFNITKLVTIKGENIVARPVAAAPGDELAEKLLAEIKKAAPNRAAAKGVYADGNFFIVPEDVAAPFLIRSLPTLLGSYRLLGTDRLREYKLRPVSPKLNFKLSSGIDYLEGSAEVDLGSQKMSLAEMLEQYSRQRYVQLDDGNRALLDEGYMRRLERIFRPNKKGDKIKISFFDLPEVEALLEGQIDSMESFSKPREFYKGFNKLKSTKLLTPGLNATLRPYQKEGVKWIRYLYDNNLGGCLADDMGLGKTIQAIAMLTLVYPAETEPTLVVMPRSLLFNWQNELARFAPQLTFYTYYGAERNLAEAMTRNLVLTTYALVRNDIEQFKEQQFHYIILDESQNIKNLAAQTTRAVFLLKGKHRLALSGTPVENNLTELYSLFRFLNPSMFGTSDEFNRRYLGPIQNDDDKDALDSLRRKIFPFMLRRLKRDVLKDLPERIEQTLYVEMDKAQADFYEKRRAYYKEQINRTIANEGINKSQFVMFQALSELRRIASVPESLSDGRISSPKLDAVMEQLTDLAANGHKTVVFFNFIAGIELLSERLEAEGIDYACMTGSTHDRRSVVERFQSDPRCRVMLMTLKTGGVGLNLTAADTVFIVEPWWNKAAEEQAINRLHRFGQKKNVLAYSMITRNTIEEKIRELQQQKAALFEGVIASDDSMSKVLSESDINFILS